MIRPLMTQCLFSASPPSFNMGPRAYRGGLSGGWSAHTDGKILKVWGVRGAEGNLDHTWVKFPIGEFAPPTCAARSKAC